MPRLMETREHPRRVIGSFLSLRRRSGLMLEQDVGTDRVWDGGGADNNWATPNNWTIDETPDEGNTLHFAGTTRLSPVNNYPADTKFGNIYFDAGAGAFTLSGNRFELLGDLISNDDSTQTLNGNILINGASVFGMNAGSGDQIVVNGVISGGGSISWNGARTGRVLSHNTYTGGTTISGGADIQTEFGDGHGTGDITLNGGGLKNDDTTPVFTNNINIGSFHGYIIAGWTKTVTLNGVITGIGELRICFDSGTVIVNGVNTYAGKTVIGYEGPGYWPATAQLKINTIANSGVACAIGAGSYIEFGQLGISRGSSLEYTGGTASTDRYVYLAGASGTTNTILNTGTGTLTFNGQISCDDGDKTLNFNVTNNVVVNGNILKPFSGNLALTKNGSGTLELSGSNTFTSLQINAGQVTNVGTANHLGTGTITLNGGTLFSGAVSISNPFSVINDSILSTNNGDDITFTSSTISGTAGKTLTFVNASLSGIFSVNFSGSFTFAANIHLNDAYTRPRFTNGSGVITIAGNITGTGYSDGVSKESGAGTAVLAGTNTYTCPTKVKAGVLRVTGSTAAASAVSVDGGTLQGPTTTGASCTLAGTVTVSNNSTSIIQPGTFGDNTMNTGALTFNGASAKMIANSTAATFSKIAVTGNVALGGCVIDFPAGITTNGTYKLITATGTMSGTLPSIGTNSTGKTLALQQTGNDLEVVVS